jgi:TrmH family RNA methyltransferase
MLHRPEVFTPRTPRVVAARRLQRRRDRDETGRFLAEGPQAVREALARGDVVELFVAEDAVERHAPLLGERYSVVTVEAIAALSETVQPQGIVAVCEQLDVPLDTALSTVHRLVAVFADIRDPGNAGTVLRTADAAGAGLVVVAGQTVDPYNGKAVRASAGSLFHVDIVRTRDTAGALRELKAAGLRVLAADAHGDSDLDDLADSGVLSDRTAWLFGSEAHGLPDEIAALADARVKVPIYGHAESLNLAAAAAVCLYTSARDQRRS